MSSEPLRQYHCVWRYRRRQSTASQTQADGRSGSGNAAYQYFEEDIKGTIKENKLADLVILDKNPLKVDVDDIRNIKVVETFKEGNSIYKA